jgi:hypothetical protein
MRPLNSGQTHLYKFHTVTLAPALKKMTPGILIAIFVKIINKET